MLKKAMCAVLGASVASIAIAAPGNASVQPLTEKSSKVSTWQPFEADVEGERIRGWLQFDCGIASCTVRFDRENTRKLQNAPQVAGLISIACSLAPVGWNVACAAIINIGGIAISNHSRKTYKNGNCTQIKFGVQTGLGEVKRGTRNCN